ncbi:hypothetical protein B0A58_13060 [Flavobacterium branchiophilum NBRC 15030 = ATCC 35035]|uniref:Dynein-related subfamily AAA family protein n=1 Tax=Flavobacterium branchiophilum TaxID=55197 RepID=A0A543G3N3_9FLAO|nr:AAA family ATPase [Flavobacterium branchiophilum]OXA72114.1 hypothetical protein B0A58_13060 [Flavobacterium branchiophilum NBRC 15030 = ATCC 35035]TQM40647.1 dynein-related subfamily AAA family protein [Flavobacterium branchiophilum]GEM54272.1 hypothetical protein FB1_04930 [Flavobacterium branchiophilum NBRC 15030 = ATCC 35035]
MNLTDISILGNELKSYFLQNKEWEEITFNNEDRIKINNLPNVEKVESHSIKFHSENNIIFIPSQYILLAIKIKPFATELKKYTDAFDRIKSHNDKNVLGEFINSRTILNDSLNYTNEDLELFKKMFSSNQTLNFGAKSIINGTTNDYKLRSASDFFGSVILKIINVPDASSAKLGSLIYNLTENLEIYDYLENRFSQMNKSNLNTSPLKNTEQKIFFGSPGTGKSYKVDQVIKNLDTKFYERVTFHPEFDNASFVGGYKPVSEKDGGISYKFVPQAFTNIYERAWLDPNNQYYLVIEEINRGNCAEIFGDIFQLLDRNSNYTVSPSEELKNHLIEKFGDNEKHEGIANGLKLPPNLTIYATMNTSDQSLFPMDSAFKRRWEWEYVPINYEKFNDDKKENKSFYFQIDTENGSIYSWNDFIKKINISHIKENQSLGMDKCIGNYFIKPEIDNKISLKQFINKVIFYLWNDVFKDEENKVFEANTYYEDFFPIETNGKIKTIELFQRIGLEPINLKKDADLIDENSLTENNEG